MAIKPKQTGEHMFSIQLKSKNYVKSLAMPSAEGGDVVVEGFLGKLEDANFTEGVMLEIDGTNGSLRMDLSKEELRWLLAKGSPKRKKKKH